MTNRQALNMFIWFALLPLTIVVWAQFLPPCALGCARVQVAPEPEPEPPRQCVRNECPVICFYAWTCWQDGKFVGSLW